MIRRILEIRISKSLVVEGVGRKPDQVFALILTLPNLGVSRVVR